MSNISTFESRTGKLNYSAEDVYNFVTDIRNFERFIPRNSVSDIKTDRESCSFRVNMLGEVNIHISEKTVFNKVIYAGSARQINDFSLTLNIRDNGNNGSEVSVILSADFNPFLKMIAAEPSKQFLATLIDEMEKFRDWRDKYQST